MKYQISFTKSEFTQNMLQNKFSLEQVEEVISILEDIPLKLNVEIAYKKDLSLTFINKKKPYILALVSLLEEYDEVQNRYLMQGDLLKAYALDVFAMFLLKKSYKLMERLIEEKENLIMQNFEFIGETYEMECIKEAVDCLEVQDVKINKAFVLEPKKTVIFVSELSKDKQQCELQLCTKCKQENCIFRGEN